jgi:hypothetical protein
MRRYQVRAKLVTPIIVQEKLWGLLIANQCFQPRHWLESEKYFSSRLQNIWLSPFTKLSCMLSYSSKKRPSNNG